MSPAGHGREPRRVLEAFDAARAREQHLLRSEPGLCFQQLHNRLQWESPPVPELLHSVRARRAAAGRRSVWTRWPFPEGPIRLELTGHTEGVNGCAVSPDGRRVVSASWDKTLKVWDLETGAEPATLTGHTGGVHGCAVSPDGRRVVSASHDRTLKVWDLGTDTETATKPGSTR